MTNATFHIINLGCKVNRVESDACAVQFLRAGWRDVTLERAHVLVINTCTVTGEAEKKTRKAVRHAISHNPHAKILVTGCAAQISPQVFEEMSERVLVVPKIKLERAIDSIIKEAAEDAVNVNDGENAKDAKYTENAENTTDTENFGDVNDTTDTENFESTAKSKNTNLQQSKLLPLGENFHTRVGVKIQDGCNNACTFCIVHVARGRSYSRPTQDVIDECVALHRAGVREIVLTGINLGSYSWAEDAANPEGKPKTTNLTQLLEKLLAATEGVDAQGVPLTRFRISSIEPADVSDEFLNLLACAQGRIARHVHLPLQSGSTKVLREMARPYTSEQFTQLTHKIRSICPQIALSTDVIAGFPGETEQDFQKTVRACELARFMKMHVFPYSKRKGTPAAARTDQVSHEIKSKRCATLRALSDKLAVQDIKLRAGSTELALVETSGRATLESYHEIVVPQNEKVGTLIPIQL